MGCGLRREGKSGSQALLLLLEERKERKIEWERRDKKGHTPKQRRATGLPLVNPLIH